MVETDGKEDEQAGVRERILDAAIAVLAESGVQRLRQVAIADRAGIRQSHLTYYFPTRSDLLESVVVHGAAMLVDGVRQVAEESGGMGADRFRDRLTEQIGEVGHMRMFLGMTVEADADPTIRRAMVAATERMERAVAEAIGGRGRDREAKRMLECAWGAGLYGFLIRPALKAVTRT